MSSQPEEPAESLDGGVPSDAPDGVAGGDPGQLEQLQAQVRDLAQTLWAARGRDELMDTVVGIETLKFTLDALELAVVRELDATHAVKPAGWASTQDFVTAVAGGHKGTGPAVVRLAHAVDRPLFAPVGQALAAGWLSTSKAQVIERGIETLPGDPDLRARAVQVLLEHAQRLDATDLKRLTRRLDPDGEERRTERDVDREDRAAHLGRHLSITEDGAGGAWLTGRCSTEDAATLKATLLPLAKPHPVLVPCATRPRVTSLGVATTGGTPVTTAPDCSTH